MDNDLKERKKQHTFISVVSTFYCEENIIKEYYKRVIDNLKKLVDKYEIIMVDDGSNDRTWDEIVSLSKIDPNVKGIRLSRNFGLQPAAMAGLYETSGNPIILLDGDLQDPPELFGSLLEKWEEGFDVVYTIKKSRPENKFKQKLFGLFYKLFDSMSDTKLSSAGLFSLMDRKVVHELIRLKENIPYVPGLRSWLGFSQFSIEYERQKRFHGAPRQTMKKLFKMGENAILSFSFFPLNFIFYLGLFFVTISFFLICTLVILKYFADLVIPGWTIYGSLILFFFGLNSFFLGIIGKYLAVMFSEIKNRKLYVVRERTFKQNQDNLPKISDDNRKDFM